MRAINLISVTVCAALTLAACSALGDTSDGRADLSELRSRVDSVGYSHFDDAGVQEIEASRILKLDVRDGVVPMASVGMTDMLGPAIGGASEPEMLLVFDGPHGREETVSRTLMVLGDETTESLAEITFWRSAGTLDEAFIELREGVRKWGFSAARVNGWIDAMNADRSRPDKYVLSAGVSPAGLLMQVEVKYTPGKPVVLRYILHLLPSFNQEKSLEVVRKTGQIPDFAFPDPAEKRPAPVKSTEPSSEPRPR